MGCHTILGEGAYYAPELTKVYERRGPAFIKAMLRDPEAMYPGQRRMVKYDFTDEEMEAMVAFLKWIGEMDLNGFPPEPTLLPWRCRRRWPRMRWPPFCASTPV